MIPTGAAIEVAPPASQEAGARDPDADGETDVPLTMQPAPNTH